MNTKKSYYYPWRHNNTFQVLIDGTEYFSSMLDDIKKAHSSILFETYLFESGRVANKFIDELCAAKKRNVRVHVLLDEYGSKELNDKDKNKLISSGVEISLYNPTSLLHFGRSLKRDHRKLLVIDEYIAYVGGAGITDAFSPIESEKYWHDVMLKVEGDIVADLTDSFNKIWFKNKLVALPNKPDLGLPSKKIKSKARVLIAEGAEKNEIFRSIVKQIRNSKKHVWLTSPYFITSWKIRRALRYAAKKGVDVRLIFPGQHSDHKWVTYGIQRYYQRLLRANVAVYEYQPRFTHAKIILCDDWFTIGSCNLDRWNQYLNLDVNIEIYDKKSHQQIIELFEYDFSKSVLVTLKKWGTRSFIQHFREWASGIAIYILEFISRKFKR
jgi:phosphatidylserine/phosphatidylglycerophosphate/cardiolipin synthase-like enzyme